jgi:glycosyltransferase involved in cell wall biosynthesis
MRLGFYYHIPASLKEDAIYVPGYLGVFLDSLAQNVQLLWYVFHESEEKELKDSDYILTSNNIIPVNLGAKTPAWHREVFHWYTLHKPLKDIKQIDAFIVRSPTPLASYFHYYLPRNTVWFMIVGDYLEAIDYLKRSGIRNLLLYLYLHIHDYFFQRRARKTPLLVNSKALLEKYSHKNENVSLIRTTTLRSADFFIRQDTCTGETIRLLYTGSIIEAKGLIELVDAFIKLKNQFNNIILDLVGWENNSTGSFRLQLEEKVAHAGLKGSVSFYGKQPIGPALNSFYRRADIYIIPSYHEGFPRTIWEAMANGLPVIATNVGGIPGYLTHRKNVLLIEPKNSDVIVEAVIEYMHNSEFRKKIISEGYYLAEESSLEKQTQIMINSITQAKK